MNQLAADAPCPCGKGLFGNCCQLVLNDHSNALTAEQLMRSRYSAFCVKDMDYLVKSFLTEKSRSAIVTNFNKMFEARDWLSLTITETVAGGESDRSGIVQFYAVYSLVDEPGSRFFTNERSRFTKEADGLWYFRSSESSRKIDLAADSECWCGSGKRFKDCHPENL